MMHVNVLKMLVMEESLASWKKENSEFTQLDHVRVDLSLTKFSEDPLTPMGKSLFSLLDKVWKGGKVPASWEQVTMVNLPKPGAEDLENLDNYRGIFLILVTLKVMLTILANRLYKACEKDWLIPWKQSGFWKREEAISQFIAVQEVVQRWFLKKWTTFGIFIDFKKAYDWVQHKVMFHVLEHLGIRGKFLDFLCDMYMNSVISVKSGDYFSDPFHLHHGMRQGCPISPLLFILFISHVLNGIPGVGVPGCEWHTSWNDPYKGGLYADNLVVMMETVEETQLIIDLIEDWRIEWDMELGCQSVG
jgi:Reverse transcriptase (RNA-dependent DNA polymerase)